MSNCGKLVVLIVFTMSTEFAAAQRRPVGLTIRPAEAAIANQADIGFTCSSAPDVTLTGCAFRIRHHTELHNRTDFVDEGPVLDCSMAGLAESITVNDRLGKKLYTAASQRSGLAANEFGIRLTDVADGRYLVGCRARADQGGWLDAYTALTVQANTHAFESDHDGIKLTVTVDPDDTTSAAVTADFGHVLTTCDFYLPSGRIVHVNASSSSPGQWLARDGSLCSLGPTRLAEELQGPLWVVANFWMVPDSNSELHEAHFMKMIVTPNHKRALLSLNLPHAEKSRKDGTNSPKNETVSHLENTNAIKKVDLDITDDTEDDTIDIDSTDGREFDTVRGSGDNENIDPVTDQSISSKEISHSTTKDGSRRLLSDKEATHLFTEGDILRASCHPVESRHGADISWTFGNAPLNLDDATDWTVTTRNNSLEWTWPWESKTIEQTIAKTLGAADDGKTLRCTARFLDGDGSVQETKESETKLLRLVTEEALAVGYMLVIVAGVVSFLLVLTVVTGVVYIWLTNKCCFERKDAVPVSPEQLAMKESPPNLDATHSDETAPDNIYSVAYDHVRNRLKPGQPGFSQTKPGQTNQRTASPEKTEPNYINN